MASKPSNRRDHHPIHVGRTFQVVITQGEDGWFIGDVPALHGCHTQGKTVAQVKERIKEAILLCLEDEVPGRFVGVEDVTVEA